MGLQRWQDSTSERVLGANGRSLKFILNVIRNHCRILGIISRLTQSSFVCVFKYLPKIFRSLKQWF